MDHGDPTVVGGTCIFVSDEHVTFTPAPTAVRWPSARGSPSSRPTSTPRVALHERMWVVDSVDDGPAAGLDGDAEIVDEWPVDLRGW